MIRTLRGPAALLIILFASAPNAIPLSAQNGKLFGQTREEFAARRAAVREATKGGIVLLFAPGAGADVDRSRYRTGNNIMYLTGVEAPRAALALLPEGDPSGKREILFLRAVPRARSVWDDPVPGPDESTRAGTGIESIQDVSQIWESLRPSIQKAARVHFEGPVGDSPAGRGAVGVGALYRPNGAAEQKVADINPAAEIKGGVEQVINRLRWLKSPGEIANLRAAIRATGNAQEAAARSIRAGVSELAIEGEIIAEFRKGGAVREGFPCIVGSGPYSTVLHHFAGDRKMENGETVVVDIGAEYNYYTADITRTYPVGGRFTPRQRELYQLVLDTQAACAKAVVPGKTTLGDLHRFAQQFMRNSPLRAKDSQGMQRTMDAFFVHGLSHWLGMDVHDVGPFGEALQPGSVFTIEPGIYIPNEGIGIRIEDDYLTTDSGAEKLSAHIPSDVAQVEALMRSARGPAPRAVAVNRARRSNSGAPRAGLRSPARSAPRIR